MSAWNTAGERSLLRDVLHDLVVDIRLAEGRDRGREGMAEYAAKCREQVSAIYRGRREVRLDEYGWPQGIDPVTLPRARR